MADALEKDDLSSHVRTYQSFVFGVRIILAATAAILILMAMFLL